MDIVQNPTSLRDRQLALEEESLTLGVDRYKKERERQDEADSGPGRRLLRDCLQPLAEAIDAFVAEARNGKPGKKHTAVRWVEKFPSSELAYITVRHCLNAISNGETRVQTVAEAIATSIEDSINYSRFREVSPGLHKHLQGVLKKSTSQRHSRNVMEAATRRTELDRFGFPGSDGIHFGMKMVELFIESTGFAELYNDSSHGKTRERVLLRGTETVLAWLDKAHDAAAHFAPVRMPMLVSPKPWNASKGGGYLTDAGGLVPLVRTRNKSYLRELDNVEMPIPIALDGSCNGLQNFSAMLRDPVGGRATNLIPQERPADIYTQVMNVAAERIRKEAEAGNASAAMWDGQLTRDLVKQPVMTLPYGVTRSGMRNQIVEKMKKTGKDDSWEHAEYLAGVLWDSIGLVVIAAREAMDWLKAAAKVAAKGGMPVSWTTPAGFPVLQEYRETQGERVHTYVFGREMRITASVEGTKLDSRRQALGISPNYVHSCDAAHLMLTVCTALENGISDFAMIHDSYGAHAADTDILAASLRAAFVGQYSRDVLTDFRDELDAQLPSELALDIPPLPPSGELDLPHSLDFRGRVYPVPGTLNPQGDDQAKALLHFARGKALGASGVRWLAIHVANLFGVDKVPFAERVQWVKDNEERILDSALDPLDGQRFWAEADSPWCALAACFEWAGYKMTGESYVSHNHFPSTDDTNNTALQTKYRADYSKTVCSVFHKGAVGTLKLLDLALEDAYDVRRQGTLMLSKFALGHGPLRAAGAAELAVGP